MDPNAPATGSVADAAHHSDVLVGESHPKLYRRNAFRIAGLPVDATMREVSRQADRLKMMERLGAAVGGVGSGLLPLDPAPDQDDLREAVQRLRDPERRLVDEVFWFWPAVGTSSEQDPALQTLAQGAVQEAVRHWRESLGSSRDTASATHNLAVLHHARALDLEGKEVLDDSEAAERDGHWGEALPEWRNLIDEEDFWRRLTERVRVLDDPRLTTGTTRRMRASLPLTLLLINARLAVESAEAGRRDDARRHLVILKESGFEESTVDEALRRALDPIRRRIQSYIRTASETTEGEPEEGFRAARRLLEQASPLLALLELVLPSGHAMRDGACDQVANQALTCQIAYGNKTEDWEICTELLTDVLEVAAGEALRNRIEQNLGIVRRNAEGSSFRGPGYAELRAQVREPLEEAQAHFEQGRRTEAIADLVELGMGRADVEISEEEKAHVDRGLAHFLLIRGVSGINDAVRQANEPTGILRKIQANVTGSESVSFLMASIGHTGKCMACGTPLYNQFAHFQWKGIRVVICPGCHQKQNQQVEEKKSRVKLAVEEASLDLGLAMELDPKNGTVIKQLEQLKEQAKELGAVIGSPLIRRLKLAYVTADEAAQHFEEGAWGVRSAAREALQRLDPERGRELSRKLWKHRGKRMLQTAAVLLLLWVGGAVAGHLLGNPVGTRRLHSVHLLTNGAAAGAYVAAMGDSVEEAGDWVLPALVDIGAPHATAALLSMAEDRTGDARLEMIRALGRVADPSALPPLLEWMHAPEPGMTYAAAGAIAAIGGPAATEGLLALLTEPVLEGDDERGASVVRPAAVTALSRIGAPGAVAPLLSAVSRGDVQPGFATIALLNMAEGDCREEVQAAADSADGIAQVVAAAVLAAMERPEVRRLAGTGRFLLPGVIEVGHLTETGEEEAGNPPSETWGLFAAPGSRFQLALRPQGRRAQLAVEGPGLSRQSQWAMPGDWALLERTAHSGGLYTVSVTAQGREALDYDIVAAGDGDLALAPSEPTGSRAAEAEGASSPAMAVAIGTTSSGRLTSGTERQRWTIEGQAGRTVRVDLESSAFDAVLAVEGPGMSRLTDDDGGSGRNSRLSFMMRQDGSYTAWVSSYGSGTGRFTLRVTPVSGAGATPTTPTQRPPSPRPTAVAPTPRASAPLGRLAAGQEGQGRLNRGARDPWVIRGVAGARLTINVESSQFDTYLTVTGPGISTLNDDDGGEGLNSRISFVPAQTGDFTATVRAYNNALTGDYTIRVAAPTRAAQPAPRPAAQRPEQRAAPPPSRDTVQVEEPAVEEPPPEPEPEPVRRALGPREVRVGMEREGELRQGEGFQEWTFEGTAGRSVRVSLVSPDFDTHITVTGPGLSDAVVDDDGGSGTNSLLRVTLPSDGTFTIRVGSYNDRGFGQFTLGVW